jgi:DNA mismatch endonuclease, patch repair protein
VDKISQEKRSWNMSRIKGKDTKPELIVRSQLHKMGFRFRLHRKDLPGKPDIVLPKFKTVIFVHGCFWHRHKNCKYAYNPKSRKKFWKEKFEINIERDKCNQKQLSLLGWMTMVIWECNITNKGEPQYLKEINLMLSYPKEQHIDH